MNVLFIKTSSLGDVVHAFPAIQELAQHKPDVAIDWMVEENFGDLVRLHPKVRTVIPVALRRWRKNLLAGNVRREYRAFREQIRQTSYDYVIDAQGLLKSVWLMRGLDGIRAGLDWGSVREPLASLFYSHKYPVDKQLHAVERNRVLLGKVFGYEPRGHVTVPFKLGSEQLYPNALWLLHGTTWSTKHWPETSWRRLAELLQQANIAAVVPSGSDAERARAERLCSGLPVIHPLPPLSLRQIAESLASARLVVGVDSGLGHIAAAMGRPILGLYGATDSVRTGMLGQSVVNLQANLPCSPCQKRSCALSPNQEQLSWPPCMASIEPERVFEWILEHAQ